MQKMILMILTAILILYPSYGQSNSLTEPSSNIQWQEVQVQFNKNVELLGLIYFIAFLGEDIATGKEMLNYDGKAIQAKEWYSYGYHLYEKYQAHRESEALADLYEIAGNLGTDYFVALFIQLDDFPHAQLKDDIEEKYFIEFSPNKNFAEAKKNVSILIDAMNRFYMEVDFDAYLTSSEAYYSHSLHQIKNTLGPTKGFIQAMESFYQQQFHQYTLIPSLTIPTGMGFGVQYTSNSKTKIFNVFGPLISQHFQNTHPPDMGFDEKERLRELSIHEFGHSFVNPVLDKIPQELVDGSRKLYKPIEDAMADQGYINWEYCLKEHFVRAGEVIIARNLGHIQEANYLQEHYTKDRSFCYLPLIIEELEYYNLHKQEMSYEIAMEKAMKKLMAQAIVCR